MKVVTADLYDKNHHDVDVCEVQFRNYGMRGSFFGRCRTLKVFEDHVPVREALSKNGEGCILVVDGGGSLRIGIMGDMLAEIAVNNGWRGVILFGAIRDSVAIAKLDLGVKAMGATARKAWDKTEGQHGVPLTIGSTRFAADDWIYADADSIVVSKKELALEIS